jgi:glucose/arabinose dehydrogenase
MATRGGGERRRGRSFWIGLPLAVLGLAAALVAARAAGLPDGFTDSAYVSGLNFPTAIAFTPDGRLLVGEKSGALRVVKNGTLLDAPFVQLSVTDNFERGLVGLAVDPHFAENGYVYVYYTTGPNSKNAPPTPKNRVSRFTAGGDTAVAGSETILLDHIPSDAGIHNAGCLRFGEDGKLYVSIGDGGTFHERSQDLGSLSGKILRLNPDGTIPNDNPFVGQAGKRPEIYCYGFRNPFRFCIRPGTNTLYIGDVGEATWEELDVSTPGGNYGWPLYEGVANQPGFVDPIHAYNHNDRSSSIIGGCFMTNTSWPQGYRGAYYYADFNRDEITRVVVDDSDAVLSTKRFTPASGAADLIEGPDGDLYYASIKTGAVRHIHYSGAANRDPTAAAKADRTAGPLPLTVAFSSAGSKDPDGDRLTYDWDFGDGSPHSSLANPGHTYTVEGTYTARLRVTDGRGGSATSDPITIRAGNAPPVVRILSPKAESLYRAGDTISFSGDITDPEDGPLPAAAYRWVMVFHHDQHTHPFLDFTGIKSGTFVIPRTGETAANTWYEIQLSAVDRRGAPGSAALFILPRRVKLNIKTSPPGLIITLNGRILATPVSVNSVVGFEHMVGAPSPQDRNGKSYTWRAWSDGGAQEHVLRTPAKTKTFTAKFKPSPAE